MRYQGAITVGGKNSRMNGFPKGKIRLNGVRLFDHVYDTLEPLVSTVAVSVHDQTPIDRPDSTRVIRDCYPSKRCSMNAVYSILRELGEPTVIVPWDMPFVTINQLEGLKRRDSDEDRGTFYRVNEVIQPFPGLYRPSLKGPLEEALENENYSIRSLLQETSIRILPAESTSRAYQPEAKHFANINSPSDLVKLGEPTSEA